MTTARTDAASPGPWRKIRYTETGDVTSVFFRGFRLLLAFAASLHAATWDGAIFRSTLSYGPARSLVGHRGRSVHAVARTGGQDDRQGQRDRRRRRPRRDRADVEVHEPRHARARARLLRVVRRRRR